LGGLPCGGVVIFRMESCTILRSVRIGEDIFSHFLYPFPLNRNIMKLIAAFSLLVAAVSANPFAPKSNNNAKGAYMNKLMRGATPTANSQLRRLDDAEEYEVDISAYSVKFEQCQFVKSYSNDEDGGDDNTDTVLATKRFVVFRLCPNNACSSCNYNYGEYLVDLETYLEAAVEYMSDYQEGMCEACDECNNGDDAAQNDGDQEEEEQDDGEDENEDEDNGDERKLKLAARKLRRSRKLASYNVDCSTCYDDCQKIANMEDNGFYDATNFLECDMIYDPEDDNRQAYYAGPICASNGSKIKIGVFTDENCMYIDSSKDVDDYLKNDDGNAMKLSHALLKTTYSDTCISCKEPADDDDENNDGGDDAEDADEVIEMCETLYDASAKCEKVHGFDDGYSNYYGYENQLANEEVVCDFLSSLKSGTYDEQGEIVVTGASSSANGGADTSGGQKLALTFFILGTVGLAMYAAMLHSKLTKGGKTDLSSSGGAMA
jgi:hypothetical protein